MKTDSPLTSRARQLLTIYTDEQILASQTHTTPNEPEILARLRRVERQLEREFKNINAQHAVVVILQERRKAARSKTE